MCLPDLVLWWQVRAELRAATDDVPVSDDETVDVPEQPQPVVG